MQYHSMTTVLQKGALYEEYTLSVRQLFFYGKNCDTKFLRSQPSLWQKIKSACRLYFFVHKAEEAGAWGCQIPNKFLPVYIQGGTCSTLCDFNGAPADLGRLASAMATFLLENDAQAVGRFLMGDVISGFFVRRVYDRVQYNRRANSLL